MLDHASHGPKIQTGRRSLRRKDFGGAEKACRKLLAAVPDHVDALHMLGMILGQAERRSEALPHLERAAALRPNDAPLQNNLGEIYRQLERLEEAAGCFCRAIELAPRFAEPHYNLGIVLKSLGRRDQAVEAFRRAIELKPEYARAHFNLANLLREEGRVKTAVPHYQHALRLQPGWAEAHWNLGATLFELGELADSRRHLEQALKLDPSHKEIHVTLGHVALADGDVPQAAENYRQGLDEKSNRFLAELRISSLAEPIPPDEQYIDDYQRCLLERLKNAATKPSEWQVDDLQSGGAEPPMALAYHGGNVRPILEAFAELYAQKIEPGEPVLNEGKPRIGIVVTHGHEGVFARCWGGIAERLSRTRFDVRLVCSRSGANILKQMIRITDDEYLVMPEKIVDTVEALRESRFDLLHYWEIGTDNANYLLPFFQPARLQTNAGGWPVTSGHARSTAFHLLATPGAAGRESALL